MGGCSEGKSFRLQKGSESLGIKPDESVRNTKASVESLSLARRQKITGALFVFEHNETSGMWKFIYPSHGKFLDCFLCAGPVQ